MTSILIYSFETCLACLNSSTHLIRAGVPLDSIEVVDLNESPELAAQFKDQNLLQAPIVVSQVGIWSGFRPDLLDEYTALLAANGVELQPVDFGAARKLATELKEDIFSREKVAA